MTNNYDRYEELWGIKNSDRKKDVYTIVEADKAKGIRFSTISSKNKLLREIRLDDLLGFQLNQTCFGEDI